MTSDSIAIGDYLCWMTSWNHTRIAHRPYLRIRKAQMGHHSYINRENGIEETSAKMWHTNSNKKRSFPVCQMYIQHIRIHNVIGLRRCFDEALTRDQNGPISCDVFLLLLWSLIYSEFWWDFSSVCLFVTFLPWQTRRQSFFFCARRAPFYFTAPRICYINRTSCLRAGGAAVRRLR